MGRTIRSRRWTLRVPAAVMVWALIAALFTVSGAEATSSSGSFEINSRVFEDTNGNGRKGPSESFSADDWRWVLYDNTGARVHGPVDGRRFRHTVPRGTYTLCVSNKAGWTNTAPGGDSVTDPAGRDRPCRRVEAPRRDDSVNAHFGFQRIPRHGTIVIVKDTVPDGRTNFDFTTTGGLTPRTFTLDDDRNPRHSNTKTFRNVEPGTYTVTEERKADWRVQIECHDPDGGTTTHRRTATIDLDAGETVTCTFVNEPKPPPTGTIVIIKDTVPDGPEDFLFLASRHLTPRLFLLDDDSNATLSNTQTFTGVPAGVHLVTEVPRKGWRVTVDCVDPDGGSFTFGPLATIDLDADETVTCTYTNTEKEPPPPPTGTIVIEKDVADDGPELFPFTMTGQSGFTLGDGESQTFAELTPGEYVVIEPAAQTPGWSTSITCVDPDNGTTTDAAAGKATIDLDAGETVRCTYTNTEVPPPPPEPGVITIRKDVEPDGPQTFQFLTGDLGAGTVVLGDGDSATYGELAAGSYPIREVLVAGWTTTISCDDPDEGTTVDERTGLVTIDLDPGETVLCTYTNTKDPDPPGRLVIVKDVVPDGPELFTFNVGDLQPGTVELGDGGSATFDRLPPGSYPVTEVLPKGWVTHISCVDPDQGTTVDNAKATATFDIDSGETVTCTFTNRRVPPPPQPGKVVIVKDARPHDPQDFVFATGALGGMVTLDDDTDQTLPNTATFTEVEPGVYTVTEQAVPGWRVHVECHDPDQGSSTNGASATIDVDPGETVTCTFINTRVPPPPPAECIAVNQRLRAHGNGGPNQTNLIPVSLPAGTYSIEVTARDDVHQAGYQTSQTEEQFVIELFATNGSLVFTSAPNTDLADAATSLVQVVNSNVNLPAIGSFRARHVGSATSANSIDVVCVRFIPVGQPPLDLEPASAPNQLAREEDGI